jgi:parallel beta-helix repeat protein
MKKRIRPIQYQISCIFILMLILTFIITTGESHLIHNEVFYVGGSGSGNYSTIQSAIDAASEGSIIYVFDDSSPYYEHILIDKEIKLVGENRNSTIIDGNLSGDVVSVFAAKVIIHGFTIQHSGSVVLIDAGIELHNDFCDIYDNIIRYNPGHSVGIYANHSSSHLIHENIIHDIGNEGIYIQNSNNNHIFQNTIHHCGHVGIVTDTAQDNIIENNTMYDNYATVSLWPYSIKNEIRYNLMKNCSFSGMGIWPDAAKNNIHHNHIIDVEERGILVKESDYNRIMYNTFENCNRGIFLNDSIGTIIYANNFIGNNDGASFYDSKITIWWRNYWDDHQRFLPKRINGHVHLPWEPTILIDWMNFDFRPVRLPHPNPILGGK